MGVRPRRRHRRPEQDVWFTGGRWAPRFLSLAVDARNNAHVTYTPQFYIAGAFSTVNSELMYATNRGGAWRSRRSWPRRTAPPTPGWARRVAVGAERPGRGRQLLRGPVQHRLAAVLEADVPHPHANGTWTHADVTTAPGRVRRRRRREVHRVRPAAVLRRRRPGRTSCSRTRPASTSPVTYANEFAGQIRLATLNGGRGRSRPCSASPTRWRTSSSTRSRPSVNGQTTFAGLAGDEHAGREQEPDAHRLRAGRRGARPARPRRRSPTSATGRAAPAAGPAPSRRRPTPAGRDPAVRAASAGGWAVGDRTPGRDARSVRVPRRRQLDVTVTPFGDEYRGGVRVARGDVTGDGDRGPDHRERRRASRRGCASGTARPRRLIADFAPFDGYHGGLWVAAGDVNGDGTAGHRGRHRTWAARRT